MSKAVLFDMDGTLVNSVELFAKFLGHLCLLDGKNPDVRVGDRTYNVSRIDELREIFPGQQHEIYEAIGYSWPRDKVKLDNAHEEYMRDRLASLYPGIAKIITQLDSSRCRLGIVTSNSKNITERRLDIYGIRDKFQGVVCYEDVKNPKPHPEPVTKCLSLLGVSEGNAFYVDDLFIGIMAGKAAGVKTIAVTWGLGTYDSLANENPDYIAESVSDLERIFGL